MKEVGKWGGGGEIFNVRTNHNQQLAIGMDRYSVYDNENEGGRYVGCGQVGGWYLLTNQ